MENVQGISLKWHDSVGKRSSYNTIALVFNVFF